MPHVKLFVYELAFAHGGHSYYLSGRKYVREHGNPFKETTTLYTTLHDGSDNSGRSSAGCCPESIRRDQIRMLGTVRVHNASSKADALAALERFGEFFLGEMWTAITSISSDRDDNDIVPSRRKDLQDLLDLPRAAS